MKKIMVVASKYLNLGKIVGNDSVFICALSHSSVGTAVNIGDTFYYDDIELHKNINDWLELKPIAAKDYKTKNAGSILIPRKMIGAYFVKINNDAEKMVEEFIHQDNIEKPEENAQEKIWRIIPLAPNYELSSDKEVRNISSRIIMRDRDRIQFYVDGKYVQYSMHQIIKSTWPELLDDGESWVLIPFAPNYEISDKKHVRNAKTGRSVKIKPNGSFQIMINGKTTTKSIDKVMSQVWNSSDK